MVTRTVNGASRDYLLLEYRGDDKLYLPSDQIDVLTPYSSGESPSLNRLGGSEWQRTRAKARAAVHEIAEELVELYRRRLHVKGHAFAPDTPWQRELEDSFAYTETVDQARAVDEVEGRHGGRGAHGPPGVRRRGLRQDRGGGARRVQGGPRRQAGGGARPHHAARPAARPDLRRALRRVPGARRDAVALSHPGPDARGGDRDRVGERGRGRRHPPHARGRRRVQGPGAARGGRGAALRRDPQGGHEAAGHRRGRAHAHGEPHPPHPGDGAHRHPRPVPDQHAARDAPADPHLRGGVRGGRRRRGPAARAAARGPGLLRPQLGAEHRGGGGAHPGARARGAHRGGARPDGRGDPRAGGDRLLGEALRRARVHHHHRVGHRHSGREHARRRPRRSPRPRTAAPAARPRRARRATRLRLPVPSRRPRALGGGV